jgi:hypothetical protein
MHLLSQARFWLENREKPGFIKISESQIENQVSDSTRNCIKGMQLKGIQLKGIQLNRMQLREMQLREMQLEYSSCDRQRLGMNSHLESRLTGQMKLSSCCHEQESDPAVARRHRYGQAIAK